MNYHYIEFMIKERRKEEVENWGRFMGRSLIRFFSHRTSQPNQRGKSA